MNANFTQNYRDKFNLYKFRELNDHHHAHDAYLTAVLGEYKTKYLKNIDYEELKKLNQEFFEKKDFRKMRHGYIVNSLDNSFYLYNKDGEVLFEPKKFNKIVENTLYRNDIIISKKTEIRKGELFNQTKNSKGKSGIPLKKNLPTELYGSYTSINPAYAALVKFGNKQRLVGIPIFLVNNKEGQLNYLRNLLKVKENDIIEIIKDKIPFYSVLNWDDQICMLVGASDKVEVINAKQFYIDSNNMKIWKRTLNRLLNGKKKGIDDVIYSTHLTEIIKYIIHKVEKEYKLYSNLISEMKEAFDYPEINHSLEEKEK